MRIDRSLLAVALLGPLAVFNHGDEPTDNEDTVEDLLKPPLVSGLAISPDGKYAAAVAPIGDVAHSGIVIFDLDTRKVARSYVWSDREVHGPVWTTNEDVAFQLSRWDYDTAGYFTASSSRDRSRPLLADDVVIRWLTPNSTGPTSWVQIVGGVNLRAGIARLDTASSAWSGQDRVVSTVVNPLLTDRIANPPGQIYSWGIDRNDEPRLVRRYHKGKMEYLHRYARDEEWRSLGIAANDWQVQFFGAKRNILYLAGYNGEETKGLYPTI